MANAQSSQAPESEQPGQAPSTSLWRNRDYLLLWGGQTISSIGGGISQIAFPLLALLITHSPAQAGLLGALRSLCYSVLVLPVGALADRWNRKTVMIVCDSGRALALASILIAAALGHLTLLQLYLVTLIIGPLEVFFDIAEVASLPQVVAKDQLPAAMGNTQATFGATSLFGPPLGGALFAISASLPFLADAVSFAASVGSLLLLRTPFQEQRDPPKRQLLEEIGEGLRWLWGQRLIRTMALLIGVSNFLAAGYTLIVIILAQRQHASDAVIGVIFGVGGVGGVLGATLAGWARNRLGFARIVIGGLWVFTLAWALLLMLPGPVLLAAITGVIWFVAPLINVAYVSYRLSVTPDALQGRVNSVARLIALGATPLGLALTGGLLQYSSPQLTLALAVGGQALVALVASANTAIRRA
ncbi:MAG TPA: MFS transporter [Ktedonobacterales bacterium]|nr:MFS transporter [Ktedonobacterales bacterium]